MHKDLVSYHKGHPNPMLYREDFRLLNGKWDFLFDDESKGFEEGYQSKIPEGTKKINVPYAYECKNSGISDKKPHNIMWYWKKFDKGEVPSQLLLHFERVDYVADVYLNGNYVGRHVGGFDAFAYDISSFLHEGENLLAVRVYDDVDFSHPRGAQAAGKKGSGFYTSTSGIYSDVWLENVNEKRLKGFDCRGSSEEKEVYFRFLFTHRARGTTFRLTMSFRGHEVGIIEFPIDSTYIEKSLQIPPKYFHNYRPEFPMLYDLKMEVKDGDKTLDVVYSYCGVNQIQQTKNYLTFDGKKRFLRLVEYPGYSPKGGLTLTEEEYLQDIANIKAMGFTGVKIPYKVESERFYYLCDREGLLTDVELPSSYEYSSAMAKTARETCGILVRDHCSHPSLIAYAAFEFSHGIEEVSSSAEQMGLSRDLYEMANRIDWTRPVLSNDGYEHTKSDVISTLHPDLADSELDDFLKKAFIARANKENFLCGLSKWAFAGESVYNNEPLIALSLMNDEKGGKIKYLRKMRFLLETYRKYGYSGYCLAPYSDVETDKNGLVDEYRQPKISFASLKKANKSF